MPAEWALDRGLYAEVFDTAEAMDAAIQTLAETLVKSNPEAICNLKKIFWDGTSHWDELLEARAEMSGRLVLSDFTKDAIAAFKKK